MIEKETITITRKYTLIPENGNNKEWNKKVVTHFQKKIEEIKTSMKNGKTKKDYNDYIFKLESSIEDINNNNITTFVINDYTYSLVRNAMKEEAQRKNYILSNAFSTLIDCTSQRMGRYDKETKDIVKDVLNSGYRVEGCKKGSMFDGTSITNTLGGYGVAFSQQLSSEFWDLVKKGLLDGKVSLTNYKSNSPFTVAKSFMSFTSDYDSYEELCEHIKDDKLNLYFNFGSNGKPTIAKFRIDLGKGKNHEELRHTLLKIYSKEYEFCGSSIQMDKSDKKIILNLTLKIPKKNVELDESTVVGVDLGIVIPAVCKLNNNDYPVEKIGSIDDFFRIRTKIDNQRRRLYKSLKYTSGGHGRKKKLQALDRFKEYEKNWVKNYNHNLSKQVVDFAIKHRAKYINIEDLSSFKDNGNNKILRNWSYYQIQQDITYKANKYGIEVRKINPYHTSQTCSCCGHYEEGQRPKQEVFICKNPECKNFNKKVNADVNAAKNISLSTDFTK